MDTQENCGRELMQKICLYFAPLLSVAVHHLLERDTFQALFSNGIFMVLLSSGYLLFIRTIGKGLFQRIEHGGIFWGCFILSFLFLGMCPVSNVGVLWLLVVAFAGLESGLELSVSLHVLLMIAYVILVLLEGGDLYAFAVAILFGFILATLFSLYRTREATLYLAVILLAVNGVLQMVRYQLNMSVLLARRGQIASEMAGILVMAFLGYIYLRCVSVPGQARKKQSKGKISEREYLEQLLEEDFSLAVALREYSADLYQHSRQVSDLSGRAAEAIGVNGLLARAGGFYHEVGRISERENYIEAGVALGEEHAFPEQLRAVIRQHSPSYENPGSPEAAVVMLSDYILSTSDYLVKNGMREKVGDEGLVHSVIQNRLSKGNLQDSGMSAEQLEGLQAYFMAHAFEKGDAGE